MSDDIALQTFTGWLSDDDLELVRGEVPVLYVDAVPVRVDALGQIVEVGLLLRQGPDGSISRMLVSGRVLKGERIRSALIRHLEKDLGPLALPKIPVNPAPFTVVEYFPDITITGYQDPRQHAVSLAYIVPVDGECVPSQNALELTWFSPVVAVSESVRLAMTGGQDRLLRLALAHGGALP